MRKAVYTCNRYILDIPVRIGNTLDLSIDYEVKLQESLIVLIPKKHEPIEVAAAKAELSSTENDSRED